MSRSWNPHPSVVEPSSFEKDPFLKWKPLQEVEKNLPGFGRIYFFMIFFNQLTVTICLWTYLIVKWSWLLVLLSTKMCQNRNLAESLRTFHHKPVSSKPSLQTNRSKKPSALIEPQLQRPKILRFADVWWLEKVHNILSNGGEKWWWIPW